MWRLDGHRRPVRGTPSGMASRVRGLRTILARTGLWATSTRQTSPRLRTRSRAARTSPSAAPPTATTCSRSRWPSSPAWSFPRRSARPSAARPRPFPPSPGSWCASRATTASRAPGSAPSAVPRCAVLSSLPARTATRSAREREVLPRVRHRAEPGRHGHARDRAARGRPRCCREGRAPRQAAEGLAGRGPACPGPQKGLDDSGTRVEVLERIRQAKVPVAA